MANRTARSAVILTAAGLLAGWWWWRTTPVDAGVAPAVAPSAAVAPAAAAGQVPPAPISSRGTLPGVVLPSLESQTPGEIAALRDAEVERSAASAPVATFRGGDGRQHAFDYAVTPAEEAAQREADARREQVLAQMRADPANFAARNGLRAREVEMMLDGSLAVPERLLH